MSSRDVSDDDLFDAGLGAEELVEQRAVRDLLRSLPDPGPVPPDVLDRITQTLHELQAEASGGTTAGVESPRVLSGATAVPLRRRPAHRVVWLAAAAALVLSGGGAVVSQLASDNSAGESAASVATRTSESALGSTALDARVHASGTDYRQADLVAQARALLATPPLSSAGEREAADDGADQDESGQGVRRPSAPAPLMSSDAVRTCLRALAVDPTNLLSADRATYEGRPALVLVVDAGAAIQVRVVSPDCRAGAIGELASVRLP